MENGRMNYSDIAEVFANAGYRRNLDADHPENGPKDRLYRGVRRLKGEVFGGWPLDLRSSVFVSQEQLARCLVRSRIVRNYDKGLNFVAHLDERKLQSSPGRGIIIIQWQGHKQKEYLVSKFRK